MKQQSSSVVTLALILAAVGTTFKTSAQTAADNFPLPTSVAAGTKVQIDGSSSLQAVNQGLKERFQKQFPGADVTVPTQYQGSDSGVQAIVEDKADLAGIGRSLTAAEKAQGLAAKTIGRSKIAIIVKDSNPYTGNLTLKDFAKIYRGEVTDWSQLPSAKGAKGKIKVIDRPDNSDTRRAFANYPVFQNGKLKTGSNAEKLTEDSTQSVVDKLGEDGIGYAPADQIKNIPGIRAVTLHSTQPDNPKYPFSQPLAYAYKNKGGQVRDGAKAFLGYASDPAGQLAIKESIASGTTTTTTGVTTTESTSPTPTPATTPESGTTAGTETTTGGTSTTSTTSTTTTTANKGGGFPWWLLPLALIGGGLLWLFGRKKPTAEPIATPTPEPTPTIKPLYPPPPARTAKGDGLSGDLSGDLSSSLGSNYHPSSDLRSGDLRSGDLSGTYTQPTTDTPNINFNGVVDTVKAKTEDINLAGGAAIAGGAAAAAALGKNILDRSSEVHPPEIKAPNIDLSNPLEGLKDKSSNLIPNLDINNPLEGIKDKAGDFLKDGGAAAVGIGGAALAGGAAIAGGAGKLFQERDLPESSDLSLEIPNLETPKLDLQNPLEGIKNKASDLIPDVNLDRPAGLVDKAGDFIKDGGGATIAAGTAALAGGAALVGGAGKSVSDLFGGQKDLDLSDDLSLEEGIGNDPFDFGNPLDAVKDKAADLKDKAADLLPDGIKNDPFDFGNPLDAVKDKAADLLPDGIKNDPFDFGNPVDAVKDKAGDLKDMAGNLVPDDLNLSLDNNPFGDWADNAGNFLKDGGGAVAATGAAAVAGGAALFGGAKNPQASELPFNDMDTFDRDLEAISLDGLDEDPFAGLSDLLGEETGDISNDAPQPAAPNDFLGNIKDKASDLLADGKGLGGAALAGGAAATLGAGKAVQSFFKGNETPTGDRNDLSGNLYSEGQITLVSPSPTQAYAHWEIPVRLKRQLREQGGQKLVVRLYDVTNFDSNIELPTIFQEFECSDSAWDLEIPIQQSEHRYVAEIGYVTADGRWLMLARSAPLWIRANHS
jgi:ABC-type phosphate transport system substrate-binding protein